MKNPWTGEDPDRGLHAVDGTIETLLERVTDGRLAGFDAVKNAWAEIVPAQWRHRARPVRLEKGVLTVEVSDGGTASRLRLEQAKIRGALDACLGSGEVAEIRFRVGRRRNWPDPSQPAENA